MTDHPEPAVERFLLDQVEAAVVATDTGGSITHWNRFAVDLFGHPAEEAIGRPFVDLVVDPSDREAVDGILDCLGSGESWQGEVRMRGKDDGSILTRVRASVTRDAGGQRVGLAAVIVDIGDLRRSEIRLAAQYAVSRVLSEADTLADATPRILEAVGETLDWQVGSIWEIDRTADTLRCVATWRAPGIAAKEFEALTEETAFARGVGLPGRVWASGEPAWIEDVARDLNFPRGSVALEEGLHGALAFPIVLGREILGVIEFFSSLARSPDQDLVTMMSAIGSQIGQFIERKEAEEDVRESESRKSAMVEGAIDCIITVDAEGKILEFNPAAERTFGYDRDEVLGKSLPELVIPPGLRERHESAFRRAVEGGRSGRVLLRRRELVGMRADGSEFPVELTVAGIDVEGAPMFTAFLRDITERRRIEEERQVLLSMEQAARETTEQARDRMTFLAEASTLLGTSLDSRKTLNKVARLAVPRLADWCSVDIEEEGELNAVTLTHVDPAMVERAKEWRRRWPPDMRSVRGVPAVIRSGRSQLYTDISDELLVEGAQDEEHLEFLRTLGIRSAMIVPLTARGRTFGAITFVSSDTKRRYGPEDLALAEELASRAAHAIDNARLYQERAHVARALQQSLLPQQLPDIEWLEVGARYRAAGEGEVGGDFYDVFEAPDGAWFAAIGDVQGKGPEAAAVTGLARYTIRAVASAERNPSRILRSLNQAILAEGTDRFATVSLARIQLMDGVARFAVSCGGHPLPYVIRTTGEVLSAECAGNLLGVFPEPELRDHVGELGPGDTLVLYTDGVTDEHAGDVLFGEAHLVPLLEDCAGLEADSVAGRIEEAVVDFRRQEPRDDMAILVLRFTPDRVARAAQAV